MPTIPRLGRANISIPPRLAVMTGEERDAERQLLAEMSGLLADMTGLLAAMVDLQMGKSRFMAFPWDTWMTGARAALKAERQMAKRAVKRKAKKGVA
jgi:hypothetical protein